MICGIYVTRNKKSGAYSKLSGEVLTKEQAVEVYARSVMEADDNAKTLLSELELYYIGEYDDKTGSISPVTPEFLLDLGSIINGGVKETKAE